MPPLKQLLFSLLLLTLLVAVVTDLTRRKIPDLLTWPAMGLAGLAAAFGIPLALGALVFVSLAGALQAVVSLIWQGALSDTVRVVLARKAEGQNARTPKRQIPDGVAIALGSVWAMWWDGNAF